MYIGDGIRKFGLLGLGHVWNLDDQGLVGLSGVHSQPSGGDRYQKSDLWLVPFLPSPLFHSFTTSAVITRFDAQDSHSLDIHCTGNSHFYLHIPVAFEAPEVKMELIASKNKRVKSDLAIERIDDSKNVIFTGQLPSKKSAIDLLIYVYRHEFKKIGGYIVNMEKSGNREDDLFPVSRSAYNQKGSSVGSDVGSPYTDKSPNHHVQALVLLADYLDIEDASSETWSKHSLPLGTKGGSSGSSVVDWEGRAVALNAGSKSSSALAFFLPLEQVVKALNFLQKGKYSFQDKWEASADSLFDGRSSSKSIRDTRAVVSSRAAEIGLDILSQTIQDDLDNITRFLILAIEPIIPGVDKPHKTSIVFQLEEGPRVLFDALAVLDLKEINLSKVTVSTTTFYLSR
ncbi:unnamed protein product [Lactuca saligna]|uniref:Uncharacterized protein n=1 Tax=Lactuca saligna TaxID=75948 RepID=A0AA35YN84_LACSI|nr:unnamed protein product [Lactuca saligna]